MTPLSLPELQGLEPEDAKAHLRELVRAARLRRKSPQLAEDENLLTQALLALSEPYSSIACYVSVGHEPPTIAGLDALFKQGKRILLPKLGPRLRRDWAWYQGRDDLAVLAPDRPPEPSGPALGAEALSEVDLIVTPALAIDRQGNRLGQGGGWYDRALVFRRPEAPVYGLCFTNELMTERLLPHTDLDIPVLGVLTPEHCFQIEGSSFQINGELPSS